MGRSAARVARNVPRRFTAITVSNSSAVVSTKAAGRPPGPRRIPAAVSQTAGTFVCNHVFYGLMRIVTRRRGLRAGFVHVPYAPGQASRKIPTMPTITTRKALEVVIATSIATRRDAQ